MGRFRRNKNRDKARTIALKLVLLIGAIRAFNSCRHRTKLTRRGIVAPTESPWMKLYTCGSDSDFLNVTGFDRHAFKELVKYLYPFSNRRSTGRPSSLGFKHKVGLYLIYCGSTLNTKFLCMIFGIVPSVCSRYLHEIRNLICEHLPNNEHAKIRFPDEQEMDLYAQMIMEREPSVTNAVGFIDGVSIPCECGEDEESQLTNQ